MWWCQSRYGKSIDRLIDNWIRHIKDVYRLHEHYLNTFEDEEERFNKFEVNAQEQVFDLAKHLLFKMLGETDKILRFTVGLMV
jgi:carbonic anhydrase